jgi:phosphatidylglycerol:prolipoprotein diacylglycerol transferase
MLCAIIGSRLLFVLSDIPYFIAHPSEIIFSRSGFSSYGGYIMAISVSLYYAYRKRLPMWKLADIIIPAVPLAEVIGRLGCFMNGCCYGKPANPKFIPWAVAFPYLDGSPVENPLYRHPTQLYQSIFGLMLFFLLASLNKRKKFHGETFLTYLIAASVIRFIIDIFREAGQDTTFSNLTVAQIISVVVFAFAIGLLVRFRKNSHD